MTTTRPKSSIVLWATASLVVLGAGGSQTAWARAGRGAAAAVSPAARHKAKLKARRLHERGLELFATERYSDAVDVFLEAHRLNPQPGLLFNAAQAAVKAKRLAEARTLLLRFLKNPPVARPNESSRHLALDLRRARELLREVERSIPGRLALTSVPSGARVFIDSRSLGAVGRTPFRGELTPGRHTIYVEREGHLAERREVVIQSDAETQLEVRLRPDQGALVISSPVTGAEVRVNGKHVGHTPLGPLPLPAGEYGVEIRHPSYRRFSRLVRVNGGQDSQIEANLEQLSSRRRSLRPYFWTTLALGTAATASGIAFAVMTRGKVNELQEARGEFADNARSIQNRGEMYSRATIGSFVAAGALLGTSLVLGLLEPKRATERARAARDPAPGPERGENDGATTPPASASRASWGKRISGGPVLGSGQYGLSARLTF